MVARSNPSTAKLLRKTLNSIYCSVGSCLFGVSVDFHLPQVPYKNPMTAGGGAVRMLSCEIRFTYMNGSIYALKKQYGIYNNSQKTKMDKKVETFFYNQSQDTTQI